MYQPIESYEKANTPVFESVTLLFASAVCDSLEKAGIPAMLHHNGTYGVEVPSDLLEESQRLLFIQPHSAEIFICKA